MWTGQLKAGDHRLWDGRSYAARLVTIFSLLRVWLQTALEDIGEWPYLLGMRQKQGNALSSLYDSRQIVPGTEWRPRNMFFK